MPGTGAGAAANGIGPQLCCQLPHHRQVVAWVLAVAQGKSFQKWLRRAVMRRPTVMRWSNGSR